jgi:hypothetical protein
METIKHYIAALSEEQIVSIGWSTTFVCVVLPIWVALTYLKNMPRLFTVMALFACSWMLVLGRYNSPHDQLWHLTVDIAAFLNVYVGGLLFSEAAMSEKMHRTAVTWLQRASLWMLFFIAAPKAIALPGPMHALSGIKGLDVRQTSVLVSQAITIVGFVSITLGASRVAGILSTIVLALTLTIYGAATTFRAYFVFWDPAEDMALPATYVIAYALLKLILVLVFCFIVLSYSRSVRVRTL